MSRSESDISAEMFSHAYCFLNRPVTIWDKSSGKVDWEYLGEGGLWLDNLHYMRYWDGLRDSLSIEDEANLLRWLRDWADHVSSSPDSKALNPPYNASERAYSLGRFLLSHKPLANKELDSLIKLVIARDLNYVASHLEFHLGGNHLLKNLMSLAWGISLFEGDDAGRWQKVIDQELSRELSCQVLADGFHYECSPMYHNLALLDILDFINIAKDGSLRDRLTALASKMTAATMLITHADGEIAFFNDCSLDSCPRSLDIVKYGQTLCGSITKPEFLPNVGIYALQAGNAMNIIVKAGALGADEQMGHAHSDLLSFEMSVDGQMLFVNSGTSTYYDQPFRDYERSSLAHNTIDIPGHIQCQHWSYFRVASRTRPENVTFLLSAKHMATLSVMVKLLGGSPRPKLVREFKVGEIGSFMITDVVTPSDSDASSHFHLDPSVSIISIDEEQRRVLLMTPNEKNISIEYSVGQLRIEDCLVSRRFNKRQASKKLVITDWCRRSGSSSLKVNIQILSENVKSKELSKPKGVSA